MMELETMQRAMMYGGVRALRPGLYSCGKVMRSSRIYL